MDDKYTETIEKTVYLDPIDGLHSLAESLALLTERQIISPDEARAVLARYGWIGGEEEESEVAP